MTIDSAYYKEIVIKFKIKNTKQQILWVHVWTTNAILLSVIP